MKDLMKRMWRATLLSLVVLLISGSVAYAAYYGVSKTLAATVTVAQVITLPSDVIGVYSDQAGTANVTSLNFGTVAPAGWGKYTNVRITMYVKNYSDTVGPEPVKLYVNAYETNFDYGYIWIETVRNPITGSWEYPSVLPGQIIPVTINLEVYPDALAGSHNFTVIIEGRGATPPSEMSEEMIRGPEEKPNR